MKKKLIYLCIILSHLFFMSVAHAQSYGSQHEKAKLRFKSKEEPTAKDATWTAETEFKVGVIDNGTPRDNYAQYVCEVLYDYGFKGKKIRVQVIDVRKLVATNKWVRLGNAYCL